MSRESQFPKLDPQFLTRWSPRAFSNKPVLKEDLITLFEAARWSPSCYNEQPWLFVYATQKSQHQKFVDVLVPGNQVWAKFAPVLVGCFTRRNFKKTGKPNSCAAFDCGSAWMALSLQAQKLGISCHAMVGFDPKKAYEAAGVSETDYLAICMIAIGVSGDKAQLPENLQTREIPNDRLPLQEIAIEKQ